MKVRHRTLEERLKLHADVHRLSAAGALPKDIAKELGMSNDDVYYWLRAPEPRKEVYVPDLSPRPELSYLLGADLGDGRTAGEQDKKVKFNLADLAFANLLNELVAKVLRTSTKAVTIEHGFYCVNYDAAVLYDFLQQPIEKFSELIESFPCAFLRGFFDAEGYASPQLDHAKQKLLGIIVGVANSNPDYLKCVRDLLESLGIHSRYLTTHGSGEPMTIRGKTYFRKHEVRHLRICRRGDIEIYNNNVGFSIPAKRDKLVDMMGFMMLGRGRGYRAFVASYELHNRRWTKRMEFKNIE